MIIQDKAFQQLKAAEHLLQVTFPLVKDPKLLIGILYNLSAALDYAMQAILQQEPAVPQSLNGKLHFLQTKYGIGKNSIELIRRVNEISSAHKDSSVVFTRGSKQVICTDEYAMEVLSAQELASFIEQARDFLKSMEPANRKQ